MTFFVWLLLLGVLFLAGEEELHKLWIVKVRLLWRRISGTGDGPTEWS